MRTGRKSDQTKIRRRLIHGLFHPHLSRISACPPSFPLTSAILLPTGVGLGGGGEREGGGGEGEGGGGEGEGGGGSGAAAGGQGGDEGGGGGEGGGGAGQVGIIGTELPS